jgi:hypothetical protein
MKKNLLLIAILVSAAGMQNANAQFHVNINVGLQPAWGPSGYDYAEYYYLPEIESYYCVPRRQFVFWDDGRWVFSGQLPERYRDYDLYGGYKVVLNERDPWCHFEDHRRLYSPYRYRHDQVFIGAGNGYNYGHESGFPGRGWGREPRDRDNYARGWDRERHDRDDHRGWDRERHDRDDHRGWGGRDRDDRGRDHEDRGHGRRW